MCKFEKISKEKLIESPSYIIFTAILNRESDFTIEDICKEVYKKLNSKLEEIQIQNYAMKKLSMFRDNGVIIEHGSYFLVKRG
ncbi:hypothetical protein B0P06_002869 [Clostridium saccharoperbutylacetonicum]|uniref:Uncharacterized protein n=1 Tax=Clostridium saccharoperbutylacetonicum N1-4(HMT) TaxID=931276 RepID=M1N5Z0_9CLOT|nr:hypothetical protein [Clostridium saccharoperbutylacetonicum]AGF58807.1 hypothetical protein Cspa_c50540 [Clostridium saccharoperbutylacetonicum N1-4(HMT)]NRT60411.1 hypothetical protein [Clostridium saccharoperbutylacetonicum]NSB23724.1 hypothetical protein [Clostridium saccharoperbutylacetonicum]NSB43098.1 hypothetical protein [Clostridium saccharoperbutylacetonicum]